MPDGDAPPPGASDVADLHGADATGPRRARWGVGGALAAGTGLTLCAAVFAVAARTTWPIFVQSYTLTNLAIGFGFLASGGFVAWFRPRNVIGVLFLVSGLGHLTTAAAGMAELHAIHSGAPTPLVRGLSAVYTAAWQVGIGWLFLLALLLFPDGRLPSRRWRPVAWLITVNGVYQLGTGVLSDGSPFGDGRAVSSILSVGLAVPESVDIGMAVAGAAATLLVIASLVLRYVRGDEGTRRRLLWLILAVLAMLVLNGQRWITGDGPILFLLSFVLIPVAIGIAIVRYELFDIRLALSRTLLYGMTIAVIIAMYAGIVAGFSLLVPEGALRGASVAAAIVVAIGFTPLRLFLQRLVDRAFHGTRSDPARTAWRIGQGLRDDDDLAGVLERTGSALRLPWLALRREPQGDRFAATGTADGGPAAEIELGYRGDVVGTLVVGLRRGESQLHEADRRTLELIATPLAVALHAITLREQVQLARTATVEAAVAERARLQRELHDGLGPTLASVTFRADAASNLVRSVPDEAVRLLGEVRADLRATLDLVRRVVYGLRPIELDDLGLLGAINQQVAALRGDHGERVAIDVQAPPRLPVLSAAVELAAYRIASEALANVLRHSDATRCRVTVSCDRELVVTVQDDGGPPDTWSPGLGLRSISDRAEELGGSAAAGPTAAGWEVVVRLPVSTAGNPVSPRG
ncbi:sensor histidine kinase [Microtetraspora malaysiensis]|uniref:sensor histidine kinase n=1 Tax=Microtetraspora malaysiensis TaxID=161358 RepID=UPI003D90EECC